MKRFSITVLGLALVLGVFLAARDSAAATGKCWSNSSGQCYHWAHAGTLPFTLSVENDVSTAWTNSPGTPYSATSYFNQALLDWSNGTNPLGATTPATLTAQNAYSPSRPCSAISGKDRVCDKTYGNNGWLGLASIWIDSNGHIIAGTVKLNDTYFNTPTYNKPGWRLLVSCQELGHTLGLDHQDTAFANTNLGTCMDYTNNPDGPPANWYANSDDYSVLNTVYGHTDSYNSFSTSASAGSQRNGHSAVDGSGDIEDAVPPGASSNDGHVFAKDIGNGVTIVSHVFWVERGRP